MSQANWKQSSVLSIIHCVLDTDFCGHSPTTADTNWWQHIWQISSGVSRISSRHSRRIFSEVRRCKSGQCYCL